MCEEKKKYTKIFQGDIVIGFFIECGKDGRYFRNAFLGKVLVRSKSLADHVIVRMQDRKDPIGTFNGSLLEILGLRLCSVYNYVLHISQSIQVNGIPNLYSDCRSLGVYAWHDNIELERGTIVPVQRLGTSSTCKCIVLGFVYEASAWKVILYVDAVFDPSSSSALSMDRLAMMTLATLTRNVQQLSLPIEYELVPGSALAIARDEICKRAEHYLGSHCKKGGLITRFLNDAVALRLAAVQKDPKLRTTFFDTAPAKSIDIAPPQPTRHQKVFKVPSVARAIMPEIIDVNNYANDASDDDE